MSIKTFTYSRHNGHENNFTRYQFLFHLWQINCVLKRREFPRSYEQDCNEQVFWHNHIWNLKLLHKWVEMVVFWRQYFFIASFHESDFFNTDFSTAKFTVKSILMAPIFDLLILVTTVTWQRIKGGNITFYILTIQYLIIIELIDKLSFLGIWVKVFSTSHNNLRVIVMWQLFSEQIITPTTPKVYSYFRKFKENGRYCVLGR